MFNFEKFSKNITLIKNQNDFSSYLESCFIELEDFFQNVLLGSSYKLINILFQIRFLYDLSFSQ